MTNSFKVAIVGGNENSTIMYDILKANLDAQISCVLDDDPNSPVMILAKAECIPTYTSLTAEIKHLNLDFVVETKDIESIREQYEQYLNPNTLILNPSTTLLLINLLQNASESRPLLNKIGFQSILDTILNNVQEGIVVADAQGTIQNISAAFTKITGLDYTDRLGTSVFTNAPDGALAECLRSQNLIKGYRYRVSSTDAEVIANASPVFIDGKIFGAVEIFSPYTDVVQVIDELNKSTGIIENLYDRLGQMSISKYTFDTIIGNNKDFRNVVNMAKKASESNSSVLIVGENGVGKELFANVIHNEGTRKGKPFIKVDCAAIPESLLETEIFGAEKTLFTGGIKPKLGKLELANSGTLFLDEISNLNLYLQAKLVRVLQENEFERVGGSQTIKADIRILAATNRNLKELIDKGEFREDLYYRLNIIEINIPPLRVRKDDLPYLINSLIMRFNRELGKKVKGISKTAESVLTSYSWPGNVRELENVIERAMVTTDEDIISHKHLSQYIEQLTDITTDPIPHLMTFDEMEKILLKKALTKFGDSVEGKKQAAKALNISLATLYNKLKRYQL